MKALTVTQPWAQLIMDGRKTFETRRWRPEQLGRIAIHAAKGWTAEDREIAVDAGYRPDALVRGAVLGEATIFAIWGTRHLRSVLQMRAGGGLEMFYGDYSDGRLAWELRDVLVYPEPLPARGALGLWEWEPTR